MYFLNIEKVSERYIITCRTKMYVSFTIITSFTMKLNGIQISGIIP